LLALISPGGHADTNTAAASAEILYMTGSSVYIDAGIRDGLAPGVRLVSRRNGQSDVVLEVRESSPNRSVCDVVEGSLDELRLGDEVRFAPAVAQAGTREGQSFLQRSGLRGRVGVRYLATRNASTDTGEFSQPALDLRLDGPSLFGSAWSVFADVRARRTTRTTEDGADESDTRNRVYRLTIGWDKPDLGWRIAFGRQVSPDLANVSVFDGVLVGYDRERWSTGLFSGSQPDAVDYGISSDIREHGAFFRWNAASTTAHRWMLTAGAVASYEDSEINREFVFLIGRYAGPRFRVYLTQEVDVNRGWKKDAGESSISSTSTFIVLRARLSDELQLVGGYDNRRNIRLYRDRTTPETQFDDAFRRGVWLGADCMAGPHLRLGVSGRTYRGGDAGAADSFTGTVGLRRLTRRNLALHLRSTRYENDRIEGWLHSLSASIELSEAFRLGIQGGTRNDDSLVNSDLNDSVVWYGVDIDVDLTKHLYLTLAAERSRGDFEEVDQLYATLACRF
ncbi:MAG: hypothetical protein JSV80_06655, partial [Acidobacteriota bacterium]